KESLEHTGAKPWRALAAALVLAALLALGTWGTVWLSGKVLRAALQIPETDLPSLAQSQAGIMVYDRHDKFICTIYPDRDKEPIPLSRVSPSMISALLAAEDHNFYRHHGIDFGGIVRAAVANYKSKKTVQGASTITQQLARNLFLDRDDR